MQAPTIQAICFDLIGVFVIGGRLQADIVALAADIQKSGTKTVCYSNNPSDYFEKLDAAQPFLYVFDETYYADTLMPKTEEAFRLLAQKTNTPPAHILFIDDTPENIRMARSAGFQTYWYDTSHAEPTQDLKEFLRTTNVLHE